MADLTLRPAHPEDEAAVAALSAHIWEGEDYVPSQFQRWLADEAGQFTLAFEGEQLVGFAKLTRVGPGEWWLEGLRVHPEHRGQGVARRLHRHLLQLATEEGEGTLRLGTSASNEAVHAIAAASQFEHIATYLSARVDAAATSGGSRFELAGADDVPALLDWVETRPNAASPSHIMEERWKWLDVRPRLAELQAQNRIYWWPDEEGKWAGFVIVLRDHRDQEEILWLNHVNARASVLPAILRALPGLAVRLGADQVRSKLPETETMRQALQEAGWELSDFRLYLFERMLS